MTIETHGVVASRPSSDQVSVVDNIPRGWIDDIDEESAGLNLGQIRAFVRRGAARINALLRSRGFDPSDLDEEMTELVRSGVLGYAVSRSLYLIKAFDDAKVHDQEWRDLLELVKEHPEETGAEHDSVSSVSTNIDTTTTKQLDYGSSFKGW